MRVVTELLFWKPSLRTRDTHSSCRAVSSGSVTTFCFFTAYGIYIQAFPSLSYDAVNVYDLTVACTDSKDTVTGTFYVYVTRNNAPVFTNLQGTY